MPFDSGDADGEIYDASGSALVPVADYDDNSVGYRFTAGPTAPVLLAASPGVVDCETGSIEYVANIAVDTEAGIYTTKINYIAAPSY